MSDRDQLPAQDAFEIEISDLDPSAHAGDAAPFAAFGRLLVRWQQPGYKRVRRWMGNGLVLCLALVLLGSLLNPALGFTDLVATHWPFLPSQAPSLKSLSLEQLPVPAVNEIQCPVASAWSPDSSQVALLGYTQSCVQDVYVPAQVDLYNATTGAEVAHWSPDKTILQVLQKYPGVSPSMENDLARKPNYATDHGKPPTIRYQQMLWSSDHSHLALSFVAVNYVLSYAGLLVVTKDGKTTQFLLQPEQDNFLPTTPLPLLWDLRQGNVTALGALSPTLAYTWDAHGQLLPAVLPRQQTDLSTYANTAPGAPDGGGTFTIWQPGHLSIPAFGVFLWSTHFAAWSPDGRYMLANFSFSGLMEPPGQAFPQNEELTRLRSAGLPQIPVHDPSLLIAAVGTQTLAWNPTATLLATYEASGVVNLYSCQTGHLLRQLPAPGTNSFPTSFAPLLSWSPDGRHLQLSVALSGRMSVWGPSSLL